MVVPAGPGAGRPGQEPDLQVRGGVEAPPLALGGLEVDERVEFGVSGEELCRAQQLAAGEEVDAGGSGGGEDGHSCSWGQRWATGAGGGCAFVDTWRCWSGAGRCGSGGMPSGCVSSKVSGSGASLSVTPGWCGREAQAQQQHRMAKRHMGVMCARFPAVVEDMTTVQHAFPRTVQQPVPRSRRAERWLSPAGDDQRARG